MDYSAQREQFATEGYAVFERILEGPLLDLLREECGRVIEREDARLDALGVEVDGISRTTTQIALSSQLPMRVLPLIEQALG